MPDISELKAKLQQLKEAIRLRLPEIAVLVAMSAKAFAERNIKEEGFGETYSTNEIPAWFLDGKDINNGGAAWLKEQKKEGKGVNWQGFRAAQGLQTAHVDLTYKGIMWAGMLPEEPFMDGDGIARAPLAGTNQEVQNEMNWNFARYGDFIGKALTPENFQAMIQVIFDEITRVIQETGIIFNIE